MHTDLILLVWYSKIVSPPDPSEKRKEDLGPGAKTMGYTLILTLGNFFVDQCREEMTEIRQNTTEQPTT